METEIPEASFERYRGVMKYPFDGWHGDYGPEVKEGLWFNCRILL